MLTVYSSSVRLVAPPLNKPECWQPYSKSAMCITNTNRSQKSICCGSVAIRTGRLPRNTLFPAAPSWKRGRLSITQGSAFYYCCTDYLGFRPRKRCLGVVSSNWFNQHSAKPGELLFFRSWGGRILQEGQDESTICHLGIDTSASSKKRKHTFLWWHTCDTPIFTKLLWGCVSTRVWRKGTAVQKGSWEKDKDWGQPEHSS